MKISEVMKATGLTERTIRFYVEKGLAAPRRSEINGRQRFDFSEADAEILRAVSVLRGAGFSIADIAAMQSDPASIGSVTKAHAKNTGKTADESARTAEALLRAVDGSPVVCIAELARRIADTSSAGDFNPTDIGNTSGSGEYAVLPPELDKWNWGAFLITPIWAIRFSCYIGLLTLIPIFGFFYAFYFAAHANEYAWRAEKWSSVDEFERAMRKWARIGFIIIAVIIAINIADFCLQSAAAKRSASISASALSYMEEHYPGLDRDRFIVMTNDDKGSLTAPADMAIPENAEFSANVYLTGDNSNYRFFDKILVMDKTCKVIAVYDDASDENLSAYLDDLLKRPELAGIAKSGGSFTTPSAGFKADGESIRVSSINCGYVINERQIYAVQADIAENVGITTGVLVKPLADFTDADIAALKEKVEKSPDFRNIIGESAFSWGDISFDVDFASGSPVITVSSTVTADGASDSVTIAFTVDEKLDVSDIHVM